MKNQIIIFMCIILIIGVLGKSARIIGGELVDIYDFPHIVSLRVFSTDDLICAGTIISSRHILTSAHCVVKIIHDFSGIRVFTGSTTLGEIARSVFVIEKIHIHPGFEGKVIGDKEYHYDIAVVTLERTIPFNDRQMKIELPTEDFVGGTDAIIYGWGLTTFPVGYLSEELRKVTVKVLEPAHCKQIFLFPVLEDQICTYGTNKSAGNGDGGGPVTTTDNVLIGVVSYSVPWVDDMPEIQSNVFANIDFIKYILREELPNNNLLQ